LVPQADDAADMILRSKDAKKLPLACTEILPASTHLKDIPTDPFALATSVPSYQGGEGADPTSNRRWTSRNRRSTSPDDVFGPSSVEPTRVPDRSSKTSSSLFKSSYKRSSFPDRLTSDECPSTPRRDRPTASPSVEPSGVPDGVTTAVRPRAGSIHQKEVRRLFQNCLNADEGHDHAQTPLNEMRIPQPCFVDPRSQPNYSKADATTSSRPLDPPVKISVPAKQERCPTTKAKPTRRSLTEEKVSATANRSPKNDRIQLTRGRSAASVEEVRQRARQAIERAREAAARTETRLRLNSRARETVRDDCPQVEDSWIAAGYVPPDDSQ
jgi:hypothetical protein